MEQDSVVYNFMYLECACVGGGGGEVNSTGGSGWDSAAPSITDRSVKGAD